MKIALKAIVFCMTAILPTMASAGEKLALVLENDVSGVTIKIINNSIDYVSLYLPIVFAMDDQDEGLFLSLTDINGTKYPLCAQINYTYVPKRLPFFYGYTISKHEDFSVLKTIYCLAPGSYLVHGSYIGAYIGDRPRTLQSNSLRVHID